VLLGLPNVERGGKTSGKVRLVDLVVGRPGKGSSHSSLSRERGEKGVIFRFSFD